MRLLQYLPNMSHNILANFVIYPELAANTSIECVLQMGDVVFVQVGECGLFLQGHIIQDFLGDLVIIVGVGHDFTACESKTALVWFLDGESIWHVR